MEKNNDTEGGHDGRLVWLDLFRGMAALAVVLFHYRFYLDIPYLEPGFLAVDMFFVLSGIVLGLRYTDAIVAGMSFGQFARVRLKRLYPMVFITALFVLVLNGLEVPAGRSVTAESTAIWTLFFLVPAPASFGCPFPPDNAAWSLWAELMVNAVWFCVLRVGRRLMPAVGLAASVGVIAIAHGRHSANFGWEPGYANQACAVVRALAWFSVGYAIARRRWRPRPPPAVLFAVLLGALAASAVFTLAWPLHLATSAIGAALLASLMGARSPGARATRSFRLAGALSFPLYLLHAPAGRLLPAVDTHLPRWMALLVVVGAATLVGTWLNEWRPRFRRELRTRPLAAQARCQYGPGSRST